VAHVVVVHGQQGFELGGGRQVGYPGQVAPLAQAPQLARHDGSAQVVFAGVMVVHGGWFDAQLAGNVLVAKGVEAALKQQILG
jgi:hypothetical protein